MGVTALPAWHVKHASARRESKELDDASDLPAIAAEVEDRLVLEEVVGVEVARPPLALRVPLS